MSRVPYTELARKCLMQHSQATAKSLDAYIKEAGFEPKPAMSIAVLSKLVLSSEVTKQIVNKSNVKRHMLFTATPLLGQVVTQVPRASDFVPEGVLMLQSILGNIRAGATCRA